MLGGSRAEEAKVALAADRDLLVIIRPGGNYAPAGPTFGELLRYLSLGWKSRSEEEEDFIGALMLSRVALMDPVWFGQTDPELRPVDEAQL